MIEKWIIDKILDAARIEEVVGDFVELHKRGVRYLGLCPFHDDRHLGSFVVYPKGNCFKCFKCEAKGGVVDFLMKIEGMSYPDAIRWLGRKYGIETDGVDVDYAPPAPRPLPPPLPMLTLPMGMVTAREVVGAGGAEGAGGADGAVIQHHTGREQTGLDFLVAWIRWGVKWDVVARRRVDEMLKAYHIGHSRHGHTIFWQIDEHQLVRTGKMMKYKADGHRDKESQWNFDFIHAALFRDQRHPEYSDEKQEMKQTLFGMHLIDKYGPTADVNIVESEKTALLMAIAYGNHAKQVWMACGGLENLSRERLKPIIDRKRRIVLYPDRDGIGRWRMKAEQLHYERVSVDVAPVTEWWEERDGEKADIADVVIRIINESKQLTNMQQVSEMMPEAHKLITNFNCEIVDESGNENEGEKHQDTGGDGTSS